MVPRLRISPHREYSHWLTRSNSIFTELDSKIYVYNLKTNDYGRFNAFRNIEFDGSVFNHSDRRYLLVLDLGDYVGRADLDPGILSFIATDRQAQSRALVDQFLVPAGSIRTRLEGQQRDQATIDHLATEFGVSSEVIRRQVENHQLASH